MLSRVERAGAQKQQVTVAAAVQGAVREVVQPLAAVVQQNSTPTRYSKIRVFWADCSPHSLVVARLA